MRRDQIEQLMEEVASGQTSVQNAVSVLITEIGRGNRVLMIDENLLGLEKELAALNYSVRAVILGEDDQKIKERLRSRIFITMNGKHFADPADLAKYYYGLIWVTSNPDDQVLAKTVEQVLMTTDFSRTLTQVVKI